MRMSSWRPSRRSAARAEEALRDVDPSPHLAEPRAALAPEVEGLLGLALTLEDDAEVDGGFARVRTQLLEDRLGRGRVSAREIDHRQVVPQLALATLVLATGLGGLLEARVGLAHLAAIVLLDRQA